MLRLGRYRKKGVEFSYSLRDKIINTAQLAHDLNKKGVFRLLDASSEINRVVALFMVRV